MTGQHAAAGSTAYVTPDDAIPPWLAEAVIPSWLEDDLPSDPDENPEPDPDVDMISVAAFPANGFAQGQLLDTARPDTGLTVLADAASGSARDFAEVSDDALLGLIGARRRLEARQAWERLAAAAELIRRRPAPGCALEGAARMPAVWAEGTANELALQLAVTASKADDLLSLAWDLVVKLPATSAALRDGILDEYKAHIIAGHCANLTPAEARQAEAIVFALPDVAQMTPGMIRDRIARAAMEVNPDAARKRREDAARDDARIVTGTEDTGNMMITGRELPPAAVLRMDQLINSRARELRKAGLKASLRELRVLAFLERMGAASPMTGLASDGLGAEDGGAPVAGLIHLTVPVTTLTDLADRPGTLRGAGPVDPGECRDLADAAAASDRTSWDFTVTDRDGRPVAHACGKPGPDDRTRRKRKRRPQHGPGPALEKISDGPDPRYGTWRYAHDGREIIFEPEHLAGPCDHRHRAAGHEPGKHLRHLTGVLNQHCTHPACRTPARRSDYEHSRPFDQGGQTCLCNAGPVCRRDHRAKQQPGWTLEQAGARGWFRWTTPGGRAYLSRPTAYPI